MKKYVVGWIILLLVGCSRQGVSMGKVVADIPSIIIPTTWVEDFRIDEKEMTSIRIEESLVMDQALPVVYIKDLQDDHDLSHQKLKQSVLDILAQDRYVWFVGHTSIQELKSLLGISFYETMTYLEKTEALPSMDALGHWHDEYKSIEYTRLLEDDLSFDLLIYRQDGRGLLIAEGNDDYAKLLSSVYEDLLYHPETIGDIYPMNTQYRQYQENNYYTYSYQVYHDPLMKKFTMDVMAYFNQGGKKLQIELIPHQLQKEIIHFPFEPVREKDTHQQMVIRKPDQSMHLVNFPASYIHIIEQDEYIWTYESLQEAYDKNCRLECLIDIQNVEQDFEDFIVDYEVKVEGMFK